MFSLPVPGLTAPLSANQMKNELKADLQSTNGMTNFNQRQSSNLTDMHFLSRIDVYIIRLRQISSRPSLYRSVPLNLNLHVECTHKTTVLLRRIFKSSFSLCTYMYVSIHIQFDKCIVTRVLILFICNDFLKLKILFNISLWCLRRWVWFQYACTARDIDGSNPIGDIFIVTFSPHSISPQLG